MNRRRLLRIAATAVVGVLVLEVLRTHVAQRYLIPSRSMEPTLHGDPECGDIVLVDKAGWLRSTCPDALRRFDVVVVRDRQHAGRPLVKRIGSLGDEMLRILDGDLFTRPLTGGAWARVQKDPGEHDLRFTFFAYRAGTPSPEPVESRLVSPAPAADGSIPIAPAAARTDAAMDVVVRSRPGVDEAPVLASRGPIDLSFVDAAGRRSAVTDRCGDDIGLELDVALDPACQAVVLALVLRGKAFAMSYGRDGTLTWPESLAGAPARAAPLGQRVALAFGFLDGRFFLEVDGVVAATVTHVLTGDVEHVGRNGVRMAVVADGAEPVARVHRIRLFHDVHYLGENQPWVGIKEYRIEPGQVFLLGDNSLDSVDSRARGPFPSTEVVGRPVAVIGPLRRAHWLPR
ncbi:MAG: S26 family signal peptidase [Planctomycetota bacterium]